MSNLPEIASLWIGGRMSFLEQLCLQSFLDQGHEVRLYVYDEIEGAPVGVTLLDAHEIFRGAPYIVHHLHGSPAVHADFFRLKLMQRDEGVIWADTDAYCYKPFAFETPHVFGWLDDEIANGVLRLPAQSEALARYDAFLQSDAPVPPWASQQEIAILNLRRKAGEKVPIEAMPWGYSGPQALTHFLKETGEIAHAQAEPVFYPMNWQTKRRLLFAPQRFLSHIGEETISFHFYGRILRRILAQEFEGLPKPGSMLEHLCDKHEIDPKAAPIIWHKS